jgi:hypothetical protein
VRRRFSQAGFDSLQRRHAFASQMTLPGSGQDRFGGKTVLNPESIFHDPLQTLLLRFCHARTITNLTPNRKRKNPAVIYDLRYTIYALIVQMDA